MPFPDELLDIAVAHLAPIVGLDRLAIYLTGSQAAGNDSHTSDVDAIALWPLDPARPIDFQRVADASSLVWNLSARRLDIVALSINDFHGACLTG